MPSWPFKTRVWTALSAVAMAPMLAGCLVGAGGPQANEFMAAVDGDGVDAGSGSASSQSGEGRDSSGSLTDEASGPLEYFDGGAVFSSSGSSSSGTQDGILYCRKTSEEADSEGRVSYLCQVDAQFAPYLPLDPREVVLLMGGGRNGGGGGQVSGPPVTAEFEMGAGEYRLRVIPLIQGGNYYFFVDDSFVLRFQVPGGTGL